jgi:hypothetical protein
MTTVTLGATGSIDLPEGVLEESRIHPGSQLVVLAQEGRIILVDRERFQQQIEKPLQEMLAQFRRSLARHPEMPFFGGLTFEEYAALSEDAEQELWDRLSAEAEGKVKSAERDIPPHFRPAGQKRR